MTTECPHCYERVYVSANGRCPACGKDTSDLAGTDPTKTKLTIRECDRLPPNCLHCDIPTDGLIAWEQQAEDEVGDPATRALATLVGFGKFLKLMQIVGQARAPRVRLLIPCCDACQGLGRPEALQVDFGAHNASFIVNRHFWGRVMFYRSEQKR